MKAKTRLKLIVVCAVAMMAALISGCKIGMANYEETLEEKEIAAQVTYYGNGGYFDSSEGILYRLVGYNEGAAFYNIQSSDTSTTVTRGTGYTFVGWYYIQTVQIETDGETEDYYVCEDDTVRTDFTLTEDEEEREVVIEYENQLVISRSDYEMLIRYAKTSSALPLLKLADEVDTTMTLTEGHIYLAASWVVAQGVNYQLVMADGGSSITYSYTQTNDDGENETQTVEIKEGEIIYTGYFGTSSSLSVLSSSPVTALNSSYTMTDGTWLEFYFDEACTQRASGTIAKPESGDVTLYALFTPGLWTVIKDSSGVKTMFSNTSRSYYLFNDVDCTGVTVSSMSVFSGTINGNGYTISNLTVTSSSISAGNYAIFGTLFNQPVIQDVTFDNLTVTYTTREPLTGSTYTPYIYMLFSGVLTGATPTISNVKITNSTMNVTVETGVTVMNIQSESDTDSWLYAITRDSGETDADFEAAYGGISLDNVKLVYNEKEIAVKTAE